MCLAGRRLFCGMLRDYYIFTISQLYHATWRRITAFAEQFQTSIQAFLGCGGDHSFPFLQQSLSFCTASVSSERNRFIADPLNNVISSPQTYLGAFHETTTRTGNQSSSGLSADPDARLIMHRIKGRFSSGGSFPGGTVRRKKITNFGCCPIRRSTSYWNRGYFYQYY